MDYKDKRWRRKREAILKRDEYLCRECKRYGKHTQAEQVHHIYPLESYPEHGLNSHNLISLCTSCHDKMHNRDTRELTELGLRWVERIKKLIYPPPKTQSLIIHKNRWVELFPSTE